MEWLWLPSLIGGFVVGLIVGGKGAASRAADIVRQVLREQATDRFSFLRVLRREIANHLMQRDPRAFERLYERLHGEVARYKTFSHEALQAERRALCERYPDYSDFDVIGSREHILYPDAIWEDDERVREHFSDIVRFQALNSMLDETWKRFEATTDDNAKHLRAYIPSVLDSRLKRSLQAAMRYYHAYRDRDKLNFDSDYVSVVHVPHVAEVRYGIHLKKTNEYGIYALFEEYRSYYGSDETSKQERHLHDVKDSYDEAVAIS